MYEYGKYPAKIYTIDGVLIYQAENGGSNIGKSPLGGVMFQNSDALSMATTIANPITFYGSNVVINQSGHSGDLYNYYWTSYSRGVDGKGIDGKENEPSWHNVYLDGYIPLRVKSIYDPCPYLYRIPSNGTWNQFGSNAGWTQFSYLGGVSWDLNILGKSWLLSGRRYYETSLFQGFGSLGFYVIGIPRDQTGAYVLFFNDSSISVNCTAHSRSHGHSVRCIEKLLCRQKFLSITQ